MTITKNQTDVLREGDVVELTDTAWPEGTKIVGPLVKNFNGSLRFGRVNTETGLNRIVVRRGDGGVTEYAPTRTLKAVKLVQPTTTINVKAVQELAMWLGREYGKQLAGMPSEWNQGVWIGPKFVESEDGSGTGICGTNACAAGHVALANGGRFLVVPEGTYLPEAGLEDAEKIIDPADLASLEIDPDELTSRINFDRIVTPAGELMPVSEYATRVLGLNLMEREDLFSGGNDFDSMMRFIGQILDRAKKETTPRVLPEPTPSPWVSVGTITSGSTFITGTVTSGTVTAPAWREGQVYEPGERVTFEGKLYENISRCSTALSPAQHARCWSVVDVTPVMPDVSALDRLYWHEGVAYAVKEGKSLSRVRDHDNPPLNNYSGGGVANCCFRAAAPDEIRAGRRASSTPVELSTAPDQGVPF